MGEGSTERRERRRGYERKEREGKKGATIIVTTKNENLKLKEEKEELKE